jgi:Meckel syndrome type 1 protein
MSTTSLDDAPAAAPAPVAPTAPTAPTAPADPAVTTFRGRTLEELLPQIRDQLGSEAIVVRQRDGLMGGIGGFFQQRFVEVDAKAGGARIDVYDEQPATPESFAVLLADAEDHADPIVTAAAFAPPVGASVPVDVPARAETEAPAFAPPPALEPVMPAFEAAPMPEPAASAPVAPPAPAATVPPAPAAPGVPTLPLAADLPDPSEALALALERTGFGGAFAVRLQEDAEAHELPFTAGDHRRAARRALARRIPTSLPHRAGSLTVAFVGAGTGATGCADALASTYVRAGRRAHAVATVEQARATLDHGAPDAVVALELPPLVADDPAALDAVARELATIELDELLVVLPAALDLAAGRALLDRLAPLAPTGIALALGDGIAARIGPAVELACTTRLPLVYVLESDPVRPRAIAPADAATLAEHLLP